MKVVIPLLLSLLIAPVGQAAPELWEACMDKADFSSNADTFLKSYRVSKSGCEMRFIELGGKGLKFELNLCDPNIHVDRYDAIDAKNYTRIWAGSVGCPAPLFGADIDLPSKGGPDFRLAKEKILDIYVNLQKRLGSTAIRINDLPTLPPNPTPDHKMACVEMLLQQYLEKCIAFEAKPEEPKEVKHADPIKGVHPATIEKK